MKNSKILPGLAMVPALAIPVLWFLQPLKGEIQSPRSVERVAISGNRRVPETTIRYYLKTQAGRPYNERQIFLDYWKLLDTRFFSDVQVRTSEGESGLRVEFVVAERPLIRTIELLNPPGSLSAEAVGQWLQATQSGVTVDSPLDESLLPRARRAVEQLLEMSGHSQLQVRVVPEILTPHTVKLVFAFESR